MAGFTFAEYPVSPDVNPADPALNSQDKSAFGLTKPQLAANARFVPAMSAVGNSATLLGANGQTLSLQSQPIGTSTAAAGNFTTLSAVSANVDVTLSPTGTGKVTINPASGVQLGGTAPTQQFVLLSKPLTGGTDRRNIEVSGTVQSDVTSAAYNYLSVLATQAASFTVGSIFHFQAYQGAIGAGSTVTSQYGFRSDATLAGATSNYAFVAENVGPNLTAGKSGYGFFSSINIPAAGTAFQFYANGTAPSYFAGDMRWDKTVTAGGTTGAATINKCAGSVNFAAAATSVVVTNSLVTANSIIVATVATNDSTMKSVSVVAAAGSFTINANAAATAETRVNFIIVN